jgi:hypothetical protein
MCFPSEIEEIQRETTVRASAVRNEIRNSDFVITKEELKSVDGDAFSFLLSVQYSDSDMVFLFPKHKRADAVCTLASVGVLISVPPVPRESCLNVRMRTSRSGSACRQMLSSSNGSTSGYRIYE